MSIHVAMMETLTITRPDDWHVHLRDGEMLNAVARYTARQFARAIVMPNLTPPVTTSAMAAAYRDRIIAALEPGQSFTPLMTCYLTDNADPDDMAHGFAEGIYTAAKLYPAGATTNSDSGVTDVANIKGALARMADIGMPLLVHGEVTDAEIDIFDRERVFIERILQPLVEELPHLRVVFEHITTENAVEFVKSAGPNVAATITAHHLHINRNAMFEGGIRPHAYCLPIAKREHHRQALRKAATSGSPKFFLGTDSAPHEIEAKESACGCAGIFSAPHALESYLKVFEEEDAIDKFEGFASFHGPDFYRLPRNTEKVTLKRTPNDVTFGFQAAGTIVVPFHAGDTIDWEFTA